MTSYKKLFEPVTDCQISMIHARSKEIGLSKDQLYQMISKLIGLSSITALSKQEAVHIIEQLHDQTEWTTPPPARDEGTVKENADRLPMLGHVRGIRAIVRAIGWDKEHLKNWLKKVMKVSSIRELDRVRARDAFVALREIQAHQKSKKRKTVEV